MEPGGKRITKWQTAIDAGNGSFYLSEAACVVEKNSSAVLNITLIMQVNTLKEAYNESGDQSATPFFTLYDFKKYLKVFPARMTLCSVCCFFCGYFIRQTFVKYESVLLGGVAQYFFKLKSTQ